MALQPLSLAPPRLKRNPGKLEHILVSYRRLSCWSLALLIHAQIPDSSFVPGGVYLSTIIALRTMEFLYPALPKSADALRILKIEPGDFTTALTSTLTSVAFSERPKYAALSYTWGESYSDNSRLPISFNESRGLSPSSSSSRERSMSRLSTPSVPRRSSSIDRYI